MMQRSILAALLFGFCLSAIAQSFDYSREFQFTLIDSLFDSGREAGINAYLQSFEDASGLNVNDFNRYVSIRTESSVNLEDACNAQALLRQRVYISGDLLGLVTIDMKSSRALTQSEAEDEPFIVADQYTDQAYQNVEYDVHTCEADYAATGRIFTDQAFDFTTCDQVRNYYPDFSNSDGEFVLDPNNGVVYVITYNTTVWGGSLSLDFVINYDSESDAIADNNYSGGEFSYTIGAPGNDFTSEQTENGKNVYKAMLNDIGDPDYPCVPPVDIDDFFPDESNSNNNSNSNTNSNNNSSNNSNSNESSSAGILLASSLVVLALFLL